MQLKSHSYLLKVKWKKLVDTENSVSMFNKEVVISIVIPVKNEKENIIPLFNQIVIVMNSLPLKYEVIFIDDHSTDGTFQLLEKLCNQNEVAKLVQLYNKSGKDYALMSGMLTATGRFIITMDGDLQNDPSDIPTLLNAANDCDIVCGIRVKRDDPVRRKFVSAIANWIRNLITGDDLIDAGCAIRIIQSKCIPVLQKYSDDFYGFAHCFYPTILKAHGLRVRQVAVKHHERKRGKTKFKTIHGRTISGFLACIKMRYIQKKINH